MKNHEQEFAVVSRQTALGNLGIGVANTVAFVFTRSSAQLADGVHGVLDSVAHLLHRSTHNAETVQMASRNSKKYQRIAGVAIAAGGLLTGYQAVDALQHPEAHVVPIALVMELGSVGLNGYFWRKSTHTSGATNGRSHGIWHNATDTVLSSVAVAGIALNSLTEGYSDGAAGLIISVGSLALAYNVATDSHEHHAE